MPALALSVVAACGPADEHRGRDGAAEKAPAVEALQARFGALPLEERLSGVVKARNQVTIRAEIDAPVVEVLVESGEEVARGQALVRLRDDRLREQLQQAEASVRVAEATAKEAAARVTELAAQVVRSRELAGEALISELELETQEARLLAAEASAEEAAARVEQARATAEERRSELRKAVVRSPVAGRIGQRNAEVGMLVDSNTFLFQVGNLDVVKVEVPLTEGMLAYLRQGQAVRIIAGARDSEPIPATLSRVSPFLAAGSFSTTGEIDVANTGGRLRPGMFVTVDVLYGESEQAALVPTSALWRDPRTGVRGVYVVDLNGAPPAGLSEEAVGVEFRPVEILAEGRSTVGLRGVEAEEWVVTVGQQLLSGDAEEGARVRPATWDRAFELQGLQREDLLRGFLEKQRRLAKTRGAEPPTSEEYLGGGATNAP